ncbi:MAG TPA: hypothetical protein DIC60_02945 [Lachnospiraceae bacterium]|nr:hypothetical protein [Lachnospiraceae bacterium]
MRVDVYSAFVLKDILQSYSSLQFSECIRDVGEIQLTFTDRNIYMNINNISDFLVVNGNAYMVENKHKTDTKDLKQYEITGRHITNMLSWRCVKGFEVSVGETYENACLRLVDENFINPIVAKRQFENFTSKANGFTEVNTIKRKYEPNDCLSILKYIGKLGGFGFRLDYDIENKQFVFQCVKVTDRSQTVIFGDKFNNISETDIYEETTDYMNVAYLYKEETDTETESYTEYGDTTAIGINRREYVEKGSDVENLLEGLAEKNKLTSAEFVIRQSEQYEYKKDYFLGDTVLLIDYDSNLSTAKPIEKITHFYEKSYEMEIAYGDTIPTIFTKK